MGKSGEKGKAKDHRGGALEGDQMKEALARASIEIPAGQEASSKEASESNPNQEIPEKVKMAADLAVAYIREMAFDALDLNDPSLGEAEKKILTETQQEINAIRDQAIAEIGTALGEAGITKEKIKAIKESAHEKILSTARSGEIRAATAPDSTDTNISERSSQEAGAEIAEKPVGEVSEDQAPPEGKQEGPETTLEQAQEQATKLVDERRTLFKNLKESGLLEKNPQLKELFEQSREACKNYNKSFGEGKRPTLEHNQEIIKYLSELLQKIKTLVSEIESGASGDAETESGETKESELNASQKTARLFSEIKDYVSKWEVGEETSFQTEKDKKRGVAKIKNFGSQLTELLNKEDELSFEDRGKLIEAMALLSGKFGQSQELKNRYYENGVFNDTEYRSGVFDDTKQQMEDAEAAFMVVAEKMFPEAKSPKSSKDAVALLRRLKSNEFKINEDTHQETYDRLTEILDDKEKLKQELRLEIANVGNALGDVAISEAVIGGKELSNKTAKKMIRDERYVYQLRLILDALDVEGGMSQDKKERGREQSPEDRLQDLYRDLEKEINTAEGTDLITSLDEWWDKEGAERDRFIKEYEKIHGRVDFTRKNDPVHEALRKNMKEWEKNNPKPKTKNQESQRATRPATAPDNLPVQKETNMRNKPEGGRPGEVRSAETNVPDKGKNPEKKEGEPGVVVEIDFARHSLKGKLGDREVITPAGMEAAAAKGRQDRRNYSRIIKKVNEGKVLEIFGSPRERTTQSSLLRMLGEQFKDANFDNVDPQDLVDWINSGDLLKTQESPLLDFILEKKGKYLDEAMKAFKAGRLLDWYVKESDQVAIEAKSDPEISTFSTQAGNVAAFIWSFGANKTKEMAEKGEKSDFAFATSHQGVLECFLYKVIMGQEGKAAADKFVESLKGMGFAENQGFKVDFRRFGEGPEDFNVSIKYEGKKYVVSAQEIFRIMNEGFMLKQKLDKLNKEEQKRVEEEELAKEKEREKKEKQEKADYREFAHRKGILEGFFLTRFIGRKKELLKNRVDRFLGSNDTEEGRYDIINRGVVKLANLFDNKFFNYRDAKSEKIESKIATIDGEIEFLKNEIDDAESIVNDQDLPYKERSKAQAKMNANKKKLRLLEQKREGHYEALHIVEQKKKECHDRISERCQGVAEAIKERVEPYKDKIEDGKRVLEKINLEISEGEAKKKEWENKLLELEDKYANSPRFQRGRVKQALKDTKKAIKRADSLIKESTKKAEVCRDKLSHLRDVLNPWDNLRAAYEDAGQLPDQQENEELKEYEKTAFEATPASWEIASNETKVATGSYVKKFNSWLKINHGRSQEELTVEKLQEALGENKNPSLKEIEDAVTTIYEEQMNERQIQRLVNNVRVDIK